MSVDQQWSVKKVDVNLEIYRDDQRVISAYRDPNDGWPLIDARADLLQEICDVVNSMNNDYWATGMAPETAAKVEDARDKLARGRWELWTSCSYLRIVATDALNMTKMGLEAVSDGKDGARLMADKDELEALCTVLNNVTISVKTA